MEKFVWICTSLFVDQQLWHLVLRDGVKKFARENGIVKTLDVKLSFNYLSGSNIRLAYKADHTQASKVTDDLDNYFKQYFRAIAPTQAPAKNGNGIFMPMPPYTIKYGLYQPPSLSAPDMDSIETRLSNCIIDALSDADIDANSLLTMGFYLHVVLINEYLRLYSNQNNLNILNIVSDTTGDRYADPQLHESYLDSEPLLNEIFNQLRYNSTEAIPAWILDWSAACKVALEQKDQVSGIRLANDLRNIVDSQLGLDRQFKTLLAYFVKQTYLLNLPL